MGVVADGGLTIKERAFLLYYFNLREPGLAAIKAGFPEQSASKIAYQILGRPRVKTYLRKLWDKAESPVVMMVRERREKLSLIARGMVGDTIDEGGKINWEAVRSMPAVKEVTIDEYTVGDTVHRNIKVKLLNPVDSIHELNLMDKTHGGNEKPGNYGSTVNNYFVTDASVVTRLERIGDRTQLALGTGVKTEQEVSEGIPEEADASN